MGSQPSQTCCANTCKCFDNDKHVKMIDVVRYSSHKWVWSAKHQTTFMNCIYALHPNVPTDITNKIKNHGFSENQSIYNITTAIHAETYYSDQRMLLAKKCCKWYISKLKQLQSLSMVVLSKETEIKEQFMKNFCSNNLPALQHNKNRQENIRRTVFIDDCQMTLNMIDCNINNIKYYSPNVQIYLILLGENDTITDANTMIKTLQMAHNYQRQCYILCRNGNGNCIISEKNQLAHSYNVPTVNMSFDNDQSIQNLIGVAVKLYWFYMATFNDVCCEN
eukprot:60729_1